MCKWLLCIFNLDCFVAVRSFVARTRGRLDPFYRRKIARWKKELVEANKPYEMGEVGYWRPVVMDIETTLEYVREHHVSIARFGDGEFEIASKRLTSISFQTFDEKLCQRLNDVWAHPIPECLNCVDNVFGSLDWLVERDATFWRATLLWLRPEAYKYLRRYDQPIGDTLVTRPYMSLKDKSGAARVFAIWKEIFADRDLLVVEGRFSRLGVGNDLFSSAHSVSRIWCPHLNAFNKYDEILRAIRRYATKDNLILLALGQTATVMAYDLAREGYWALDVGHIDVEYMWMKMGAQEKVAIPNRYVNEVQNGHETKIDAGEEVRLNVLCKVGVV